MDQETRNHRRRFGQNFLIDEEVIRSILSDFPTQPGWVIEIGPGGGALTKELRQRATQLTLIEMDPIAAEKLSERWSEKKPTIRNEDASKTPITDLLQKHSLKPWVIGNLPYNMAGPILRHWVPHLKNFLGLQIMVQLEVAKRICAQPGSSDYGYLSSWIQNWATPQLLRKVSPDAFRPRPNVQSATLELKARTPVLTDPGFILFLQQCFSQKRKMLINNLKMLYPKEALHETLATFEFPASCRAEELGVEKLAQIYTALKSNRENA